MDFAALRQNTPDEDGYFGEAVAAHYDAPGPPGPEVVAAVDVLAELAAGGRVLEFAIGTGRIALPLAERGVEVAGIELSRAMLARLRAKPGGDALECVVGDFSSTRVAGEFSLVYLVYNTIQNVTTQDGQVETFRNAAAHLAPGGRFLVENVLPNLRELPRGRTDAPFDSGPDTWAFSRYDIATQSMSNNRFTVRDGRATVSTIPFRYVWPAELDLMARIAGLRLEHRWTDWDRSPFHHESRKHVSVWRKDG
ncbi:class I SAM-dependent methyltransferase [Actinosynnema pretiosum subsp. pretiosum]|uniref:Class I SAM-dependent methyltransferase n=1 Tax=Actinosynnema pretiosum subsp. pretiosum TaxID=103721 RepID=A0AA45L8X0_9PSEU|nr:Methyltransferase SCO0408 [Actinosynnema pretiosum subsp. pretiosum]QUF05330.1 class I SAM-dependent methyltransferase [Actinosynnema pretiosum subsp. pretiosum]